MSGSFREQAHCEASKL